MIDSPRQRYAVYLLADAPVRTQVLVEAADADEANELAVRYAGGHSREIIWHREGDVYNVEESGEVHRFESEGDLDYPPSEYPLENRTLIRAELFEEETA